MISVLPDESTQATRFIADRQTGESVGSKVSEHTAVAFYKVCTSPVPIGSQRTRDKEIKINLLLAW